MDGKDIIPKIKEEWKLETYMWTTVVLLVIVGIAALFIGRTTEGDLGYALIGTGLSLIFGSIVGSFAGRGLGWPFGWIFGVLISLIFTPIFGNYLAGSVGALSASIAAPMVGLIIGLWAEKEDKKQLISSINENI